MLLRKSPLRIITVVQVHLAAAGTRPQPTARQLSLLQLPRVSALPDPEEDDQVQPRGRTGIEAARKETHVSRRVQTAAAQRLDLLLIYGHYYKT